MGVGLRGLGGGRRGDKKFTAGARIPKVPVEKFPALPGGASTASSTGRIVWEAAVPHPER